MRRNVFSRWLSAALAVCLLSVGLRAQEVKSGRTVSAQSRASVIEGAIRLLNENYVFPETAKKMEQAIRERAARGEYDAITDPAAFARALGDHLLEICKDKHLRVVFRPEGIPPRNENGEPSPEERERERAQMAARNFGFEKLERLSGNIGYIDLRNFLPAEFGGETVAAAMTFLAGTDALIFDLRQNGGGSPGMVALISSYLFDKRTHLNDLYHRPRNTTEEFWTKEDVPGRRYGGAKPVYVLTSRRTFSAGEEFTYNLKNLKRATIIGETTGGGAHPVRFHRIDDHFGIGVPFARAVNPISKTNWEGTGVAPDTDAPAAQALKVAHLAAINRVMAGVTDQERASQMKTLAETLGREIDEMKAGAQSQAAVPAAPAAAEIDLPKTAAGKVFGEFIRAFNTGKLETLRKFHREHGGSEENAEQDVQAYGQIGELRLHGVAKSSETAIDVLAQSRKSGHWYNLGIDVEAAPPHMITDIRVRRAAAPGEKKSEGNPPEGKSAAPKAPVSEADLVREVGSLVEKQVAEDNFSGVVLIARNGRPVFERAVGMADKERKTANRPDTRFNLGSINKIFTRIAILQLVETGGLSLDDTLGKHLPDYPNKQAAEKVTVRHLVNMQSGIGDIFGPRFTATPKEKLRAIDDYLPLFAADPLKFEPGTSRAYSNGGYIVLGAIIEKVTGKGYYDYVRERIFKPAAMNDTESFLSDAKTPNLAEGYTRGEKGERISNRHTRPARGSSAGGGYSTAPDLLKFSLALQNGKLLNEANTKSILGRGLGIAGGAPGINAILEIEPSRGGVIVVLSNYDPPSAENLGQEIRKLSGWE
ncbi:MAG: serine hydrolase [Blastocatellia bacterium]